MITVCLITETEVLITETEVISNRNGLSNYRNGARVYLNSDEMWKINRFIKLSLSKRIHNNHEMKARRKTKVKLAETEFSINIDDTIYTFYF